MDFRIWIAAQVITIFNVGFRGLEIAAGEISGLLGYEKAANWLKSNTVMYIIFGSSLPDFAPYEGMSYLDQLVSTVREGAFMGASFGLALGYLRPILEHTVGRDHNGASLIPLADDLKK